MSESPAWIDKKNLLRVQRADGSQLGYDPKLMNTRLAYVAVSRRRYSAQIYTDAADRLSQALSKDAS